MTSSTPLNTNIPPTAQVAQNLTHDWDNLQRILDILVRANKLSLSSLNQARAYASSQNKSLTSVLIDQKIISEEDYYRAKAQSEGHRYVNVASIDIPIDVLNTITREVAQQNLAVPFGIENGKLQIATVDPGDLQKIKFLQVIVGQPVEFFMSSATEIKSVIDKQYGARINSEVEEALEEVGDVVQVSSGMKSLESPDLQGDLDSAPVSRIVNMILEYAVKYNSSDVHIEPRESNIIVRFRISGVLFEKLTLPKKLAAPLVSRIKILSNLKIDEHRLPQDGRFQIQFGAKVFDLRVSTMPNIYGEKVVMRLLESGGGQMKLEDTGLRGWALKSFYNALTKTEGLLLVTGPTGSGKTRTLASGLQVVNKATVNILTLEDPVEIRIDGVTQVQVKPDIGLTFASGLRAFLRQDPDVVMVGEIRDVETASLAVQAALTGHLVLATLHTNSAAGAVPRLLDMKVEPFLLSSTLNVIVAQRLTRKICDECKERYLASPEEVAKLHEVLDGLSGFDLYQYPQRRDDQGNPIPPSLQKEVYLYRGKGCTKCNGSGYNGRIGIFEVLNSSEKISQMIMQHRSAYEIEDQARHDGMVSIMQDGFLKCLEGITSIPEVLRVIN